MLLIVVDSYTKWLKVFVTSSTSSTCVIENLRKCFSVFGLPLVVVSDNGTCFTSEQFKLFLSKNGIRHVCSPPRHPASNGQAEDLVKVVESALERRTKKASRRSCRVSFAPTGIRRSQQRDGLRLS